ncbi:MAG: WYL domain-containing protein [Thermoplasmataceae archaeon]
MHTLCPCSMEFQVCRDQPVNHEEGCRGYKYITVYCHLRNAVRTFKRSRIRSIEPV